MGHWATYTHPKAQLCPVYAHKYTPDSYYAICGGFEDTTKMTANSIGTCPADLTADLLLFCVSSSCCSFFLFSSCSVLPMFLYTLLGLVPLMPKASYSCTCKGGGFLHISVIHSILRAGAGGTTSATGPQNASKDPYILCCSDYHTTNTVCHMMNASYSTW